MALGLTGVVAVAAVPRSGSTLLCDALGATGAAGMPDEYLNPARMVHHSRVWGSPAITWRGHLGRARRLAFRQSDWRETSRIRDRSLPRYLDLLGERRRSPNGVLAIKLMWPQYDRYLLRNGLDLGYWGVPVRWIRTRRADRVAQAVSFDKARQSGQWRSTGTARAPAAYDRDRIASALAWIEAGEEAWDDHLDERGVEAFTVVYEDLATAYETTVRAVLDHLGLRDAPVAQPLLEKQADEQSVLWAERFVTETEVDRCREVRAQ